MKSVDIAVIAALVLIVGAIIAYLIKNRKKGDCASCPYAKSCPRSKGESGEKCAEEEKNSVEDIQNKKD